MCQVLSEYKYYLASKDRLTSRFLCLLPRISLESLHYRRSAFPSILISVLTRFLDWNPIELFSRIFCVSIPTFSKPCLCLVLRSISLHSIKSFTIMLETVWIFSLGPSVFIVRLWSFGEVLCNSEWKLKKIISIKGDELFARVS